MFWPTSQDYNEAIQNAATSMSDPELKKGEATINALGLPVPRSGNFADVYQFKGADGKMWAIKCFTRQVSGLEERYARIDEHLSKAKLRFTVGFQYLKEGIRIRGKWYPILKMEWVEGFTLNDFVRQNADKPHYLHALTQMWGKLAGRLREANFAHADLQHGNVLLVPGASPSKLGLKLIDYDGMWVPALASKHSGEVGHPNFQHPLRIKDRLYNSDVDRFPHLVIACGLRATLVGGKKIWDQFDNGDNLLFREQDLCNPTSASIFKTLWSLNDPILRTLLGQLALSTQLAPNKTPWLDEILFDEKRIHLNSSEEKQVVRLLAIEPPETPSRQEKALAAAPPPMAGEFQFYADADDDDLNGLNEGRTRHRPSSTRRRSQQGSLFYVGGGVLALALIAGVIALLMGDKKHPHSTPVAQDTRSDESKTPGSSTGDPDTPVDPNINKKDPPENKIVENDAGGSPFKLSNPAIGLVAIPHTSEFLFVGPEDTTLSWGDIQPGTKPKKIGQHHGRIRTLTCSPDGSKALTATDEGEVFIWQLKEAKSDEPFREVIIGPETIKEFKGKYRFTVYQDGVVVEDTATKQLEAIAIGQTACEVSGEFKKLWSEPGNEKTLGVALTDETGLFNDALLVQVFQSGIMFASQTSQQIVSIPHGRHKVQVKKADSDDAKTKPLLEETVLRKPAVRELTPLHKLKIAPAPIRASAIALDNTRAVTIGEDDSLCLWNIKLGKLISKFKAQTSPTVAFLPDGKRVLLGTDDDSAFGVWNIEGESREKEFSGHKGAIHTVCVTSDGKIGYTSGADAVLRCWDLQTGAQVKELDRNKVDVKSMILRSDNRFVVFADVNGIHAWEPETGKVLPLDPSPASALSFFDDAQELLCTQNKEGEAGAVRWVHTSLPAIPSKGPEQPSTSEETNSWFTKVATKAIENKNYRAIGLSNDGKYLCALRQSDVTIIDPEAGVALKTFTVEGWVTAFAFGIENELHVATRDGKLEVWDWAMGEKLSDLDTKDGKLGLISSLAVSSDQKRLVVTTNTPMLAFFDTVKRSLEKRISPYPDDPCQRALFYPDGKYALLVYPTLKKRYSVWDLRKNQEAFTLDEPEPKNIQVLGISPNGRWIVGYQQTDHGLVFIWDAGTGKLMPPVSSIDTLLAWGGFSASGNYFTFWEFNGRRSIIHLDEAKVVQSDIPKTHPYRAAFASKGNLVVSLDSQGHLQLERMEKDDPPATVFAPVIPKKTETPQLGFVKSSPELSDMIGGSCFSTDGKTIFVGTQKGILHLLEPTTLEEITQYRITKDKLLKLVHSSRHVTTGGTTPERIYLMDNRRHIYQWDVTQGKTTKDFGLEKVLPNPNQTSFHLAVPPDGNSLIFTSRSGNQPHYWNLKTDKEAFAIPTTPLPWIHPPLNFSTKSLHRVAFSADGRVAGAYADSKLLAWNTGGTQKNFPLIDTKITPDWLAVVPEATVLIAAESSKLDAWNYTVGKHLWSVETHENMAIIGIAAIPKSAGFVTIGNDLTIRVWDSLTGKEIANWKYEQPALGLAISPDGKYAITQHTQTHQLRMWALPTIEAKKP